MKMSTLACAALLGAHLPLPLALAQATPHPLLVEPAASTAARALADAVEGIAGGEAARDRARGLIAALHKALAQPATGIRTLVYPPRPIAGQLSVVAIVPPGNKPGVPIGICLQQGVQGEDDELVHTNIGTLQIAPDGSVAPHLWTGNHVGGAVDGKFQAACAPYRADYIEYIQNAAPG